MSRKHPGHYAYAISSHVMDSLEVFRQASIASFKDTAEYVELQRDSCFSRF